MTIEDITRGNEFNIPQKEPSIIKVIGVGGGGNNAVKHMYEQGIKDVSFVIINTDNQALRNSPVPTKLMIGPETTGGLGAGNKPEVAREAAEESIEEIRDLFDPNTQMVFITAGMGGGTGTGAAPIVAREAKESGKLTVGIVTIPFLFEGRAKIEKALDGAEEMGKYVDALLVVNNERLTEIYPDLQFMNAFGKADDTLSIAAQGISEMITTNDGVINIDFKDVKTTLINGGAAIISIGYGEGEGRLRGAIQDALNSPLLKDHDISTSRRILFNIYYNPDSPNPFVMKEASELTDFITQIYPGVDVIWGLAFDRSLGDKIKITLLAAGFDTSANPAVEPTPTKNGNDRKNGATHDTPTVIDNPPKKGDDTRLIEQYGKIKTEALTSTRETQKQIILSPDQLTNDEIIEIFEANPTFTRDANVVKEIRQKASEKNNAPAPSIDATKSSDSANQIDFLSF